RSVWAERYTGMTTDISFFICRLTGPQRQNRACPAARSDKCPGVQSTDSRLVRTARVRRGWRAAFSPENGPLLDRAYGDGLLAASPFRFLGDAPFPQPPGARYDRFLQRQTV